MKASKIYDFETFRLLRSDLVEKVNALALAGDEKGLQEFMEIACTEHFKRPPMPPKCGLFDHLTVGENKAAFRLIEALVNQIRTSPDYTWGSHFGLYGPASVGKTTAAIAIAGGLEVPYFCADSSFFNGGSSVDHFVQAIITAQGERGAYSQKYCDSFTMEAVTLKLRPTVLFIDEAHMLSTANQNILLTAMEAPYKTKYKDLEVDWRDVVIILATTDSSELVKPLRTRTHEVVFESYSEDTITEIVQAHGVGDPETARRVAQAAKLIPRSALKIAAMLKHSEEPDALLKDLYNVDLDGLDARDRKLLAILASCNTEPDPVKLATARRIIDLHSQGSRVTPLQLAKAEAVLEALTPKPKPVGLVNLADRIGVTDTQELRERINALVNRGFVTRTPRGIILNIPKEPA